MTEAVKEPLRRLSALQRFPPPFLFAVPLIIGILLQRRFPLLEGHAAWVRPFEWLGVALIALGVGHALSATLAFLRRRTTIIPHHTSSTLVTTGAYRWTRNPMYLGLVLTYLGVALLTWSVWALLLLPLPVLAVNAAVIPMEERSLHEAFGPAYEAYKLRVRRWI